MVTRRRKPQGPTADEWNSKHPVGTRVAYKPHPSGGSTETTTTTPAWNLGHGEAVVSIDGKSGGVALWSLTVLEKPPEERAREQTLDRAIDLSRITQITGPTMERIDEALRAAWLDGWSARAS